jgi:hypothetical protein
MVTSLISQYLFRVDNAPTARRSQNIVIGKTGSRPIISAAPSLFHPNKAKGFSSSTAIETDTGP